VFKHEKQMLQDVKVDSPNPTYAAMLQEQLGGPNGELKAGLQYISQSFRVKDPAIRDLLLDIGAEELSHMEMVATLINQFHGREPDATSVQSGEIESQVLGGLAPLLVNASGAPWTAAYLNVTGDLPADILSNIAAEQCAKVVYEHLYRQINDNGARNAIDFLLNREEAHSALFREALKRVQDAGSQRDFGVTEDSRLYFDLSTPERHFADPRPAAPRVESGLTSQNPPGYESEASPQPPHSG